MKKAHAEALPTQFSIFSTIAHKGFSISFKEA